MKKKGTILLLIVALILPCFVCETIVAKNNSYVLGNPQEIVSEKSNRQSSISQEIAISKNAESYELEETENIDVSKILLEDQEVSEELLKNFELLEKNHSLSEIEEKQLNKKDVLEENSKGSSIEDNKQQIDKTLHQKSQLQNMKDIRFTFESANDIMSQYITKDKKTAKLLNNRTLYSYNIKTKKVSIEYQFPKTEFIANDGFYGSQDRVSAYMREDVGLLYFGYNSCYDYSENETMHVIVYDLEKGKIVKDIKIKGHILDQVGADKKGNIFISTDDVWKNAQNKSENTMFVLSKEGKKLCQKKLDDPVNSFSGFCKDGTFFYIDEYMAYSPFGYPNLMGRLMKGKFQNNKLTLQKRYMTYAKNIYFGNYQTPVEIINDKYLVTFTGGFYPLASITDKKWSQALYTPKELEKGSEYSYIYNAGVNAVIKGDEVYTLYDNDTIYVYSMKSGKKQKFYNAKAKIFNLKSCGNTLLALETDGTHFFYEKIPMSSFRKISTKNYNMNDFSVYKGRTKDKIIDQFVATAPAKMKEDLYAKKGSNKKPYKESTLKSSIQDYTLKVSNYYRWLAGLTPFESASKKIWSNAAKGAVLLSVSDFDHEPEKPSNMSSAFYREALEGTSNSNIAMNYSYGQYKIIDTIRQFMNDTSYTMPGHRTNFLTRNATTIAYGIYDKYLCQTVEYKDNPNPSGTAVIDNNEPAYAWPAAGYFPAEDLSVNAYWTVNLNTDKLSLSNVALKVTITDLETGKSYKRTSSADGLYATEYWGRFISFAPPTLENGETSYNNKRYKVKLTNLSDKNGFPATLEYTINFFSYSSGSKKNEASCDKYGQLLKLGATQISLSNAKSGIKISWKKKSGADGYYIYRNGKKIKKTTSLSYIDKAAKKNGSKYQYKVIAYKGKKKGKESKSKTYYFISSPTITSIKRKSNGDLTIKWKQNAKASGYQIQYTQGKKTTKIIVSGGKKTNKTISNVKAKEDCKISIRAYKKVGKTQYDSVWNKDSIKAVKVSSPALQKVTAKNYHSLQIQWKKGKDVSGYKIYRKNGTAKYKKIATVSKGDICTYTDTKAVTGTKYTYTVKAYKNYKKETIFSSYDKKGISGTTALSKPTLKTVIPNGIGNLIISWKKVDGASGYMLYRAESKSGSYQLVKTLKENNSLSFKDSGLGNKKTYYYKLKAYRTIKDKKIYSSYSDVKNGQTEEAKPSEILPKSITFNKSNVLIDVNERVTLKADILPSNATNKTITWSSSDTKIASVDKGVIIGKSSGTATITAKTCNEITVICKVTVKSIESSKITIYNIEDLKAIANNLDEQYSLEKDIDLSETTWVPIGTEEAPFSGTFEGNGHKISGLKMENSAYRYNGLFGCNTGTIEQIEVSGIITSNQTGTRILYAGGIVGLNKKGNISSCSSNVKMDISSLNNDQGTYVYVGGIAGSCDGAEIHDCRNYGTISASAKMGTRTDSYVGGIVGYIGNMSVIQGCTNEGTISSYASCSDSNYFLMSCAGGITGYMASGTIENCENHNGTTGSIKAEGKPIIQTNYESMVCAAEIIGYISNGTVIDVNVSNAKVEAVGNHNVMLYQGGIIGKDAR